MYVITGVQREFDDDIAFDDRLAAQPRVRAEIPRGVEAIQLIVLRLAEIALAFFDKEVTCRAGTASATGMLERDPVIHCDIKKRLRQTVMQVFELAVLELDGRRFAVFDEGDLRHFVDPLDVFHIPAGQRFTHAAVHHDLREMACRMIERVRLFVNHLTLGPGHDVFQIGQRAIDLCELVRRQLAAGNLGEVGTAQ